MVVCLVCFRMQGGLCGWERVGGKIGRGGQIWDFSDSMFIFLKAHCGQRPWGLRLGWW